MVKKTILVIGTYDTKDEELNYVCDCIVAQGGDILTFQQTFSLIMILYLTTTDLLYMCPKMVLSITRAIRKQTIPSYTRSTFCHVIEVAKHR